VIVFKLDAVASQLYEGLRNTLDYKTPIEHLMHVLHRSVEPAAISGHSAYL
jgi:hypothetical protein